MTPTVTPTVTPHRASPLHSQPFGTNLKKINVPNTGIGKAELKKGLIYTTNINHELTDAEIAKTVEEVRQNSKLTEHGNTYISSWVKGILGHIAFLFPNGRKKYMEGLASNQGVQHTETMQGQVAEILKTYDENVDMLIEMKQKYLRIQQKIIDKLDRDVSIDQIKADTGYTLDEIGERITDTDEDIMNNMILANNLVLQIQAPEEGLESGASTEAVSDMSKTFGSQPQQHQTTLSKRIHANYQKFKSDPADKKATNEASKQGQNPPPGAAAEEHPPTTPHTPGEPPAAGHTPSVSAPAGPSKFGAAFKGLFTKRTKGGGGYVTHQNGGAIKGNNNKTRKNREYIHEVKENRKQLFDKEMEIINSIRNFKHGQHGQTHDKRENIKKEFINVIKRK